jgi:hypothetical protein
MFKLAAEREEQDYFHFLNNEPNNQMSRRPAIKSLMGVLLRWSNYTQSNQPGYVDVIVEVALDREQRPFSNRAS